MKQQSNNSILQFITQGSLVLQILIGIIAGSILAVLAPSAATSIGMLGSLFVGALKAVAPVLVFVLVAASVASHKRGQNTQLRPIIYLYLFGTFAASLTAVAMSFMFPTELVLVSTETSANPPQGIGEVLHTLLFKIVDNPISAIMNGMIIHSNRRHYRHPFRYDSVHMQLSCKCRDIRKYLEDSTHNHRSLRKGLIFPSTVSQGGVGRNCDYCVDLVELRRPIWRNCSSSKTVWLRSRSSGTS